MSSQSSHLQASPSALVELRRASKSFAPQSLAVRDLSIAMGPDTYVVVVGPSGCGKTTLLRLIAGLESPTSGTVHIGGSDAASLPPHARGVALAAQGAPLYPHLTVRENLGFAARARLVPAAVVRDRVEAIAQSLLITDFLARLPGELSGGQRQRVALGRALVQQAPITLLDEPLAALEPDLRGRVRTLLRERQRATAGLFIHVTHDHEEAMALADELVVMHGGMIRQHGPTSAVLESPSDRFVAEFLSDPPTNFFGGRVEVLAGQNEARFVGEDFAIAIPHQLANLVVPLAAIGTITMSLPAEALRIAPSDDSNSPPLGRAAAGELVGTVTEITPRAGRIVLQVRVGTTLLRAVGHLADGPRIERGSRIRLIAEASKSQFFESGPLGRRFVG